MIKAVIFDCDGTLVDSEESHYFAWRHALQNFGGDLTPEEYLFYVGRSAAKIAELFAEKISCDSTALFEHKTRFFLTLLQQGLPPVASTVEMVKKLASAKERLGIKLAVASATLKHEVICNLKQHGIEDAFELVISGHDDLTEYQDPEGVNKPKPYIYLHTAKLLGVKPEECVVIEDSSSGVAAAVSAGCVTIAIPNRHTQHHDLSKAVLRFDSLADLSPDQFLEKVTQKLCNL